MALDQWPLCHLIMQTKILKLADSPKYLMKNEMQMFASAFPYLHLFNHAQTELRKFVYTFGPEA